MITTTIRTIIAIILIIHTLQATYGYSTGGNSPWGESSTGVDGSGNEWMQTQFSTAPNNGETNNPIISSTNQDITVGTIESTGMPFDTSTGIASSAGETSDSTGDGSTSTMDAMSSSSTSSDSGITGDDSGNGTGLTGDSAGIDDSSSSSSGSDGPSPTPYKSSPWFVSYRGSDVVSNEGGESMCGRSPQSPCRTIAQTYANVESASIKVMEDATILIEVAPNGITYKCESDPSSGAGTGLYIYSSLTFAPYSYVNGILTVHGAATNELSLARFNSYVSLYESEFGPLDPTSTDQPQIISSHASSRVNIRDEESVTFNCEGKGRLFYAYSAYDGARYLEPTILRMVNIKVTNSSANENPEGYASQLFISGGASLIAENCTFEHSVMDATNPDQIGSAIYSYSASALILSGCSFLNHFGRVGSALHFQTEGDTYVMSRPDLQSWLWIDGSYFDSNMATDLGGAIRIAASQFRQLQRLRIDVTRTDFINNQIVPGPLNNTKMRAEGGAIVINLQQVTLSSFLISGCQFIGNKVSPLQSSYTQLNSHQHGGAIHVNFDDLLSSSRFVIIGSTFDGNSAGVGGGVLIEPTSQIDSTFIIRNNRFTHNRASDYGHMAQGGAIGLNPGPRIDRTICETQCKLSQQANTYIFDNNYFEGNFAEGVGGAILMYYHTQYGYYNASVGYILTGQFEFPLSSTSLDSPTLIPDRLTLSGNTFFGNLVKPKLNDGQAGVGGSVAINLQPDLPLPVVYDYATEVGAFQQFLFSSITNITQSSFVDSSADCSACYGGSLYLKHGQHYLANLNFTNSYAGSFGGSLFMDVDSTTVTIDRSSFTSSRSGQRGQVIHSLSSGSLTLSASRIRFDTNREDITQLDSAVGGQMTFSNQTTILCPAGFSLRNHSVYSYRASTSRGFLDQLVSSRSYSCQACPPNTYSLDYGFSVDDNPISNEVTCFSCPFGGNCDHGRDKVQAREGNWASTHLVKKQSLPMEAPNQAHLDVSFFSCPDGYCCPIGQNCDLGYCANHRRGILCSECDEGFSMVLLSAACRPSNDCNDGAWFWVVIFIATGIFSVLLYFSPKAPPTVSTNLDERKRPPSFSAIAKIILYFYQMLSSILTPASESSLRYIGVWLAALTNFQLNFDVNNGSSDTSITGAGQVQEAVEATRQRVDKFGVCISPNMNGVDKIAYGFVLPCLAALWLLISYILFRFLSSGQSRAYLWMTQQADTMVKGQAMAAAIESEGEAAAQKRSDMEVESDGNKLTFEAAGPIQTSTLPNESSTLPSNGTGADSIDVSIPDSHSFAQHDGNKTSYPSSDIEEIAKNSTSANLPTASSGCQTHSHPLSCVFSAAGVELFLLSYSALLRATMSLLQCVDIDGESRLYLSADVKCYTGLQVFMLILLIILSVMPVVIFGLGKFIRCSYSLRVVQARYVQAYKWYEAILMLRRYIFVLFLIFVLDPFVQSYLLLLTLLASLAFHQSTRPFCSQACNYLESICLFCLTCIAGINVRSATLQSAQIQQPPTTKEETQRLDAFTLFLVLAPGMLVALLWVANQIRLYVERKRAAANIERVVAERQVELEENNARESNVQL